MGDNKLETDLYRNYIDEFVSSVKSKDKNHAKHCFNELKKMLHPSNPQLVLLEYQLKGVLND